MSDPPIPHATLSPPPKQPSGISTLLRGFASQGRGRASTTTSSSRPGAVSSLAGLLGGSSGATIPRPIAAVHRDVRDLAAEEGIGPYDSTPPHVFIDALRDGGRGQTITQAELTKRLATSVRAHSSADVIAVWLDAGEKALRDASSSDNRIAGLALLRACAETVSGQPETAQGRAPDRAVLYRAITDFVTGEDGLEPLVLEELYGVTAALGALVRGGRDVAGLEGLVDLLCEMSTEVFRRRQSARVTILKDATPANVGTPAQTTALNDASFATPFIRMKPGPTDYALEGSPMHLLTAVHKFSWPHLSPGDISAAADHALRLGMQTTNDVGVKLALEHVSTLIAYGCVPTHAMETTADFVARVVGVQGRVQLVTGGGRGLVFEPLPDDLPNLARKVMRDLLRSPAHQMLQHLRAAVALTVAPGGGERARCDTVLVAGSLRCLREAMLDLHNKVPDHDKATDHDDETFPVLLSLGLPFVHANLVDAVGWRIPEVDEEVLRLIEDRMAVPRPLGYEEWAIVLDLLERLEWHLPAFEKRRKAAVTLDRQPDVDRKSAMTEFPNASQTVIDLFSSIFARIVAYNAATAFVGPLDRLIDMLARLSGHLSDDVATFMLRQYDEEQLCLPSHGAWLERLAEVAAFLDPIAVDMGVPRPVRTTTRATALRTITEAYTAVRDSARYREEMVETVIMPLLARLLRPTVWDPELATGLLALIDELVVDALVYAQLAASVSSGEAISGDTAGQLFDRLRVILVALAHMTMPRSTAAATSGRRTVSAARSVASGPSHVEPVRASPATDVGVFGVAGLIGMFDAAVRLGSAPASTRSIFIFRDLLALIAPSPTGTSEIPRLARFAALQFLVRLRARQDHRVHVEPDPDVSALAVTIGRGPPDPADMSASIVSAPDETTLTRGRSGRTSGVNARHAASSPERVSRSMSIARPGARSRSRSIGRGSVEPLWSVPETPFAPIRTIPLTARTGLLSFDAHLHWTEGEAVPGEEDRWPAYDHAFASRSPDAAAVLPVSEYLRTVVRILEIERDFDVVAYVLCHIPTQLAGKHFASGPRAARELRTLRAVLCRGLRSEKLAEAAPCPPGVKRSEVFTLGYQAVSTLIAYRTLFNREQQTDLIQTFLQGLGRRDIAKPCIHALHMSCHELPGPLAGVLSPALAALQRIVSSETMAVHILELIAAVGLIPALYSNLSDKDLQTVFGIALQYISFHNQNVAEAEADPASVPPRDERAIAFSQYVFHLAYYVIDLWYMSLRVGSRIAFVSFITRKLVHACEPISGLNEPAVVCLDMVTRYAHANVDPRPSGSMFREILGADATPRLNADAAASHWLVGNALITIRRLGKTRWTEVVVRRPSGIVQLMIELENAPAKTHRHRDADVVRLLMERREPFLHANPLARERLAEREAATGRGLRRSTSEADLGRRIGEVAVDDAPIVDERHIGPSFFAIQLSMLPDFGASGPPLLLIPDEGGKYLRALEGLDRMPVVDNHKIGVLYVGPGQGDDEIAILRNTHGSRAYLDMLHSLGRLVPTRDAGDIALGGLDMSGADADGRWTYVWDNQVEQVVFHVATLMPTLDHDPYATAKKRHIGNDFVKVVYNDSGRPTRFDISPSQFDFVNIVIEPQTPAGKAWSARGMSSNAAFFKVSMQMRPGMPSTGPLGPFKLVSAGSLGALVRELVIHANLFSQVYLQSVGVTHSAPGAPQPPPTTDPAKRQRIEYVSHWRARLRQIQRLKQWAVNDSADARAQLDGETRDWDVSHWTR